MKTTGKKKFEEIPDNIIKLRRICYINNIGNDREGTWKKIKEYFDFWLHDKNVQQEITAVFTEYDEKKLFISIF